MQEGALEARLLQMQDELADFDSLALQKMIAEKEFQLLATSSKLHQAEVDCPAFLCANGSASA